MTNRARLLAGSVAVLSALGMLPACGDSDAVGIDDVRGTWVVQLVPQPGQCEGGPPPDTLELHLQVAQANGSTEQLTGSEWGIDGTRYGELTGTIAYTTGTLQAVLWNVTNLDGAALDAVLTANGQLTGTLHDPHTGYGALFASSFCISDVTGTRD